MIFQRFRVRGLNFWHIANLMKFAIILEGSAKLMAHLKDMNDSSNSIQQKILKMEMQMHEQNMKYKHQKDKQVQELASLVLLNRSTMVIAMVTIAEAVKVGRNPIPNPAVHLELLLPLERILKLKHWSCNPNNHPHYKTKATIF